MYLDLSWLDTSEAIIECTRVIDPRARVHDSGIPPIDMSKPAVSQFEFWSMWRLYGIPLLYHLRWAWRYGGFRLPVLCNPEMPLGGWVGESKIDIFDNLRGEAKAIVPNYVGIDGEDRKKSLDHVESKIFRAGIEYPFVVKPAVGCRGVGVQLVKDRKKLISYLEDYPAEGDIVVQRLVPYMGEVGLFYYRKPGEHKGTIFGITLKYFLEVTGDGKQTLEQLIEAHWRAGKIPWVYKKRHADQLSEVLNLGELYRINFAGSHSRGTIFRDGTHYQTEALRDAMDRIADGIPEFCFGRFDFRFRDFQEFLSGKNMAILEINGAGGEATNVWDSGKKLGEVYSILKEQYRLMYEIGAMNKRRGYKEDSYREIVRAFLREKYLMSQYPHTD